MVTFGLKQMRHVKANARGFVLHTAGHAASGAPIQIGWMREGGTEGTVYERIMGHLFGSASGTNTRPEMLNATLSSDHGYWTVSRTSWGWRNSQTTRLASFYLQQEIHCWTARYVFDCILHGSCFSLLKLTIYFILDKPENLSKVGFKNDYLKQVDLKISSGQEKKLQVLDYRSGTGTSRTCQ
jgi:hypothetical protein